MRSKCINSTSGRRKSVTGNGFTTLIAYMTWKFCRSTLLFVSFGNFSLRIHSLNHIRTSALKFDVISVFTAAIFLQGRAHFLRVTPFSTSFVMFTQRRRLSNAIYDFGTLSHKITFEWTGSLSKSIPVTNLRPEVELVHLLHMCTYYCHKSR